VICGAEYQAIDSRQSNNRFANAGDKIGEKQWAQQKAVIPTSIPALLTAPKSTPPSKQFNGHVAEEAYRANNGYQCES
jgi:hypothetical protein